MNAVIRKTGSLLLTGALLYAGWLMLRLTLPYTAFKSGIDFLKTKISVYHITHWRWSFYTHIFTALPVLLCGMLQFSGYVIRKLPRLHRISGYIYVVDVLLITGPAA